MRSPMPPLAGLEAFEAVARLGTIVSAAGELSLSSSAVSNRLRSLEAFLGLRLFDRNARSLAITTDGIAYISIVRKLFDDLSISTYGLFGGLSRDRSLTIRAQVSYASRWLAPRLPEFIEANPDIAIRLVSAIWADETPDERIDLDLRAGHGNWPGYRSLILYEEEAAVYASPAFIADHGPVIAPDEVLLLPRAHVLSYENLWATLPSPARERLAGTPLVRVDTWLLALELAVAGDLCTMAPAILAERHVADGTLVELARTRTPMGQGHYVLIPDDGATPSNEALLFLRWLGLSETAIKRGLAPANPQS